MTNIQAMEKCLELYEYNKNKLESHTRLTLIQTNQYVKTLAKIKRIKEMLNKMKG
jgi:hypothetical protein